MTEALAQIIEDLQLFDDWAERYRYIIDLGRTLPPLPESYRRDEFLVPGCSSKVWLVPRPTEDGRLAFFADSDAVIVRGLVALLLAGVEGQPARDVAALDWEEVFDRVGLASHLSVNRTNGLRAMAQRLRRFAVERAKSI